MNLIRIKLKTYWQLGIANIATVALYRIAKKIGLFEKILPIIKFPHGYFFLEKPEIIKASYSLRYFSYKDIQVTSPPDWLLNPFNNKRVQHNALHWSKHPDFDPDLGDIKMVWEASRFDWLPKLALEYSLGNNNALSQIEHWLQSWITHNPVNQGVNWKCGQEASFRCINLMVALIIIDNVFESPTPLIKSFLFHHLTRISLTLRYAMAQDNNHGTSEASALFIAGHYLSLHGDEKQKVKGKRWARQGRYWLENRVKKLIMNDGSFSQNSVVYHRLLLDTLSVTELFRKKLKLPTFSKLFYQRASLATFWLHSMTDYISGDAPNLGANDGAYLFNLNNTNYRDFRPSIDLASRLFLRQKYSSGIKHPLCHFFDEETGEEVTRTLSKPSSFHLFPEGGYARIEFNVNSFAIIRLPYYRFRPSDADALHVDIWHEGKNLLRDAGTYSYNASNEDLDYFPGTESHNTIQFDEHNQMPRLGRFLFGGWLRFPTLKGEKTINNSLRAEYTDAWGAHHGRSIFKTKTGWLITDEFYGFKQSAILHWNLHEDNWVFEKGWLISPLVKIRVSSQDYQLTPLLKTRLESLHYGEKQAMPLLEINCTGAKKVTTEIVFC